MDKLCMVIKLYDKSKLVVYAVHREPKIGMVVHGDRQLMKGECMKKKY